MPTAEEERKKSAKLSHSASASDPSGQIGSSHPANTTGRLVPQPATDPSFTFVVDIPAAGAWTIEGEVSRVGVKKESSFRWNITNYLIDSFVKSFSTSCSLKHQTRGWAIMQHHTTGQLYELQMEVEADEKGEFKFDHYERKAYVKTIPGDEFSHGKPDVVLSVLADGKRVPIFYLDLKLNAVIPNNWPQVSTYMLTGFRHMKAATGKLAISGGILNYDNVMGSITFSGCTLSFSSETLDFSVHPWVFETRPITVDDFMARVCEYSHDFDSIKCNIAAPPHLLSWAELSAKVPGLPSGEMKECPPSRHSLYHVGGEYIKVMYATYLTPQMLALQEALKAHMLAHLPKECIHVIADWQTTEIGPHLWVVRSKDAGGKYEPDLDYTKEDVVRFIEALLHLCLLPPLKLAGGREYLVMHGDLRPGNVTNKLKVIDFEFLGYLGPRLSPTGVKEDGYFEITYEQRVGRPTICTNVWQVGLLISQMFFSPLPPTMKTIDAIAMSSPEVLPTFAELNLTKILQDLRFRMVTQDMWKGRINAREATDVVLDLLEALVDLP